MKHFLILISMLLSLTTLQANMKPIFYFGYDFGGDELADFELDITDEFLNSGAGYYLEGGLAFEITEILELQALLGYKTDNMSIASAELGFSRVTASLLGIYKFGNIHFGAGLGYHFSPTLEGDGLLDSIDYTFDDTSSYILQASYTITDNIALGARATLVDYDVTLSSSNAVTYSGNSLGLFAILNF